MYSNDPTSPHRALCYFLDPAISADLAYVQFPQRFQGLNKNDIYGGEIKRVFTINSHGLDGLCGANYVGSNTFHARRALFDSSLAVVNAQEQIGSKMILEKAVNVAGCDFEAGTKWGDTVSSSLFLFGNSISSYF
jgi:Cellulose synthase